MAQTLTRVLVHLIFSTKNRVPLISPEIESHLHSYIGGICRNHESPLIAAGGMPDHVHVLVSLSKNIALSNLLMEVKKDSSKWIKDKGPGLEAFGWQDGYGGFSIGESGVEPLQRYFANQKEHHKKKTFEEELVEILKKYRVPFDPKYLL
jgi:REP element-mobilizing transposase RayT